ncbi:hypothetical protein IF1G_00568 [Cordyceps javanica]|uniref:Uncharacterized protein n=1 Tax=Cordyceps javanica TaxID=43265 RepID=A0A545VFY3_9HYPO|nr:hypothetical protein IF1G_00568 [Cordyceps javanica]
MCDGDKRKPRNKRTKSGKLGQASKQNQMGTCAEQSRSDDCHASTYQYQLIQVQSLSITPIPSQWRITQDRAAQPRTTRLWPSLESQQPGQMAAVFFITKWYSTSRPSNVCPRHSHPSTPVSRYRPYIHPDTVYRCVQVPPSAAMHPLFSSPWQSACRKLSMVTCPEDSLANSRQMPVMAPSLGKRTGTWLVISTPRSSPTPQSTKWADTGTRRRRRRRRCGARKTGKWAKETIQSPMTRWMRNCDKGVSLTPGQNINKRLRSSGLPKKKLTAIERRARRNVYSCPGQGCGQAYIAVRAVRDGQVQSSFHRVAKPSCILFV